MFELGQRFSYVLRGAYALLNNQGKPNSLLEVVATPAAGSPEVLVDPELTPPSGSLTLILEVATPELDFPNCLTHTYNTDPFFKDIYLHPEHFRNFSISDDLIFLNDNLQCLLCVPNIWIAKNQYPRAFNLTHT